MPYGYNKIIKANKPNNLSLLPTYKSILTLMIPDQESKSTVPPTCLVLPYYPLPPSMYLCAQLGSLDSPACPFIR